MRIRLASGRVALFGAMLVLALVAFLPLRLVLGAAGLGDAGLTARRVDGSVWGGSLTEASAAGLRLGDLAARLAPFDLVAGRARVDLASRGDDPLHVVRGALAASRHALGAEAVSATLPAAGLFRPLPITALDLDEVTVRFRDGVCDRAEGRVRATMAGEVAGLPLTGVLAGTARCDAGRLLLPLASAAGTERIELRLTDDGRYTAALTVAAPDPALAQKLAGFGFQAAADGYRLSVEGRF
ncbi:MAG: type II secretion system protein N [Janthinobacterium lividum]